eukprot:828366_1
MATQRLGLWFGVLSLCMFHVPIWLFIVTTSFNMVRSITHDLNTFVYTLSKSQELSDNFHSMPRPTTAFSLCSSTLQLDGNICICHGSYVPPNHCESQANLYVDQQSLNDQRYISEQNDTVHSIHARNTIITIGVIVVIILFFKYICLRTVFIVIIQISMANSVQILRYNTTHPAPSIIRCGLQQNCDIICQTKTCAYSKFYLYNNEVTLRCLAKDGCYGSHIHVINATSFHLISSGQWGFHKAKLWSYGNNQNISFTCEGNWYSCQANTLYINGMDHNIQIRCKSPLSCNGLKIYAVQSKSLRLYCQGLRACVSMIVKAPSDPSSNNTVVVHGDHTAGGATISSLYGNVEFICADECISLDLFRIIYGMGMSHSCQVSDEQCMNGLQSTNQAMNALNIQIEYVDNVTHYNQVNFTDDINHLVIFVLENGIANDETLHAPQQISSVHVICVYACHSATFNFSLIQNASFMADTASFTTIVGSTNSFKRISYGTGGNGNTYHLNHTKQVEFLCQGYSLETGNGGCLKSSSYLFLSDSKRAFIGCGSNDCSNSDIYIDSNPYTDPFVALDIRCYNGSSISCDDLLIHFGSANAICNYTSAVSYKDCNYTSSPTTTPTLSPSNSPSLTPTDAPTNPSLSPTLSPSKSPTLTPTCAPTFSPTLSPSTSPSFNPTHAPTLSPTISPSNVPISNPTHAPSLSPTLSPSNAPTLTPTHAPTFSPTISPSNSPTLTPTHAPTFSPSISPSNAPTNAPTTCFDYNASYNSLDGSDRPSNIVFDEDIIAFVFNASNVVRYIAKDHNTQFQDQHIYCNQTTSNVAYNSCFIGCYDRFSCGYKTHIVPVTVNRLEQVTLVCSERYSCHGLTVNVTNVVIDRMTITCISRLSCVDVTIHVDMSYSSEFILHCNASLSCSDTSITLGNKVNSNIFCYDANACDSMSIHT